MSHISLLEQLGNPIRHYDGRNMQVVHISLCIKKEDAHLNFYNMDGTESDTCVVNHLWKFSWPSAPMGEDVFSMLVSDVYVVDDLPYYYVTVMLTDDFKLDAHRDQLVTPEIIDWEDRLLPWRKYERYTYTSK